MKQEGTCRRSLPGGSGSVPSGKQRYQEANLSSVQASGGKSSNKQADCNGASAKWQVKAKGFLDRKQPRRQYSGLQYWRKRIVTSVKGGNWEV